FDATEAHAQSLTLGAVVERPDRDMDQAAEDRRYRLETDRPMSGQCRLMHRLGLAADGLRKRVPDALSDQPGAVAPPGGAGGAVDERELEIVIEEIDRIRQALEEFHGTPIRQSAIELLPFEIGGSVPCRLAGDNTQFGAPFHFTPVSSRQPRGHPPI